MLYHPEFKSGRDRIYFSKEVSGKSDYYYIKLVPNEISTYEEGGKKYTTLKKSGKKIHSDDFSEVLQLAKNKKFNIYTFDEYNAYIGNKYVILEGKSSAIFNGSKGKWIER
jgi:hypothetical protein